MKAFIGSTLSQCETSDENQITEKRRGQWQSFIFERCPSSTAKISFLLNFHRNRTKRIRSLNNLSKNRREKIDHQSSKMVKKCWSNGQKSLNSHRNELERRKSSSISKKYADSFFDWSVIVLLFVSLCLNVSFCSIKNKTFGLDWRINEN